MGFAKYQEDIYSRYVSDQLLARSKTGQVNASSTDIKNRIDNKNTTIVSKENKMSDLKNFTIATPRPLPVIILADASGSMSENGKIEALNQALKDMVKTFSSESRVKAEIQVGLITFGGDNAQLHLPLAPARLITDMKPIPAKGRTPLGQAFNLAKTLLDDQELVPSRAYRPVLILISDGLPTDDWAPALATLQASTRAQKATRFAMAIGDDADEDVLAQFANDPEAPVFKANQARDIHRFFRAVTMSVTSRSASANPDQFLGLTLQDLPDEDDLDLDF